MLKLLTFAALSASAFADLMCFSDNACMDYLNMEGFNCGLGCTSFDSLPPDIDVHSVDAGVLEPNTQVVLYKSKDCSGGKSICYLICGSSTNDTLDAYAAIGAAYGSSAGGK